MNHFHWRNLRPQSLGTLQLLAEEAKKNAISFEWTLSPGVNAHLQITGTPTQEDKDFLKLCLDRAIKKLLESQSES